MEGKCLWICSSIVNQTGILFTQISVWLKERMQILFSVKRSTAAREVMRWFKKGKGESEKATAALFT